MNKKVWISVICLCWIVLLLYALSKLFFGAQLAVIISSERLMVIGDIIDRTIWLKSILCYLTTWLTYFLYFGAVSKHWVITKKYLLIMTIVLIPMQTLKIFLPEAGMQLDIVFMILYPYFLKAKYKTVAIVFTAHYLGQLALLYTRSLPLLLIGTNFLTQIILSIDAYILLVIYYLYSNKYKEESDMGQIMPPLFGKKGIVKQLELNKDKIIRLQEENIILEKAIADNNETSDCIKNKTSR